MEVFLCLMSNSLATLLAQLKKKHYSCSRQTSLSFILQHLDDFCIIGLDRAEVRRVTKEWMEILTKEGFVVSPKLVLEPTNELRWPSSY